MQINSELRNLGRCVFFPNRFAFSEGMNTFINGMPR